MKQQLIQKEAEEEIVIVPVPIEIHKYFELLKRKKITIWKDEINRLIYYLGDNFVHVINASGKFNQTFYYHENVLIAEKDKDGKRKYYHPDHLGSTTLITNASGSIVEETFYLPFGEILEGGDESRYGYNEYINSISKNFDKSKMELPKVFIKIILKIIKEHKSHVNFIIK